MLRNHAMNINSFTSIVARTENAKDRRLAIRNSWTDEEESKRRRMAIESQLHLVALISIGQNKTTRVRRLLEMAS